jgi:hypothetical protein
VIAGAIGATAIGLPIVLAVLGLDFLNPRNLIAALVPLLILVAIGFGSPGSGRLGESASLAACTLFAGVLVVVNTSAQMQRPRLDSTPEIDVLSTNFRVEPFKRVDEERRAPIFFLWRYRANRTVTVRVRDLAGDRVLSERSAVLVPDG